MRIRGRAALVSAVLGVLFPGAAPAAPGHHAQNLTAGAPVAGCTPDDDRLVELSGLAVHDETWFATGDGGAALHVSVLDPATCATVRSLDPPGDPLDVEDLAVGADGAVWFADIGDNRRSRETVALFVVPPDAGSSTLYRLRYPDGPHDAEALLLQPDGTPVIVTKELTGAAAIYVPAAPLDAPGPTDLVRAGQTTITPTSTTGGPVGAIGSLLVTGGAVSADGTVAVLRTYTDAYVFPVVDGDVAAALQTRPTRVALPDEPQGEAVAVSAGGDLVSGSEAVDGVLPPIRVVAGAAVADAADASAVDPDEPSPPEDLGPLGEPEPEPGGVGVGVGAVLAVLFAGAFVWIAGKVFRRR